MQTGSSRKTVRALVENAAFLAIALMLSYIEVLLPLTAILPLPGAKLGLANLAVMAAAHRRSVADAALVSLVRVVLSALLFGSIPSMLYSLSGAALSLITLGVLLRLRPRSLSWVGISVSCAAAHNLGQLFCAAGVMHTLAVFSYMPLLLSLAAVFGTLLGILMNLLSRRIPTRRQGDT